MIALSSCADPDRAARDRYGETQYLYAGAGCDIGGVKHVDVKQAKLFKGIHRTALVDSTGRFSASDVYFDSVAVRVPAVRSALHSATPDAPLKADVTGWRKDCGGLNVIFLVDTLQVLQ
jgi:hypothetical protein